MYKIIHHIYPAIKHSHCYSFHSIVQHIHNSIISLELRWNLLIQIKIIKHKETCKLNSQQSKYKMKCFISTHIKYCKFLKVISLHLPSKLSSSNQTTQITMTCIREVDHDIFEIILQILISESYLKEFLQILIIPWLLRWTLL